MPPTVPQPITFDARPLSAPVDPQAVTAFVRAESARGGGGLSVGVIIGIVFGGIAVTMLVPVAIMMGVSGLFSGNSLVGLPFLCIALICIGVGIAGFVVYRRRRVVRYRLSQFAAANGMTYQDAVKDPPLPGMIFSIGGARKASELVRGHSPRFVEFGNYQYTVKHGKNSTTYKWGYVAVKLDVPLPNIVLDALGNNGFGTNLPAKFSKDQQLSLEGDFDKYFTLYCPKGYETDALYLFTPDIMARFVDNAAQLDIEIVDDWLFLYTRREASTLDAVTWAWLFSVVGALITKFDQWARWRDDRLLEEQRRMQAPALTAVGGQPGRMPAPTVAQSLPFATPAGILRPPPGVSRRGLRLKRGTPWLSFVVIGLFVLAWFWVRTLG